MVKFLLILAGLVTVITAMPGGAPSGACGNFLPQHSTNAVQTGPNPYTVNLSGFPTVGNVSTASRTYVCGEMYAVTIASEPGNDFRGFLIQARQADSMTTTVGTFVNLPASIGNTTAMARIGNCEPTDSSATHVQPTVAADRVSFSYVKLYWRAPAASCNVDIVFRYTVVQQFTTWYGPGYSDRISSAGINTSIVVVLISMILVSIGLM